MVSRQMDDDVPDLCTSWIASRAQNKNKNIYMILQKLKKHIHHRQISVQLNCSSCIFFREKLQQIIQFEKYNDKIFTKIANAWEPI